ncbi:MAG: hypothetical protein M1827_002174 [Pycnora praestabilis]|nr:MAG: hypothetical protein M1827_002174 [Pycnora praestabilis]
MADDLPDKGFEFFNAALVQGSNADSLSSPGDTLESPSLRNGNGQLQNSAFPFSEDFTPKTKHLDPTHSKGVVHKREPVSAPSSASPETSSQDSSSDSSRRHKRESSSNSSQSALTGIDVTMTDFADMQDWKPDDLMIGGNSPDFIFGGARIPTLSGTSALLSTDPDYEISNKAMENHFDFESAASSPSALGAESNMVRGTTGRTPNSEPPFRGSPSPSSNLIIHASPSVATGGENFAGPMLSGSSHNPAWPANYDFSHHGLASGLPNSGLTPSPVELGLASPFTSSVSIPEPHGTTILTLHPTPLKSRVETQIPIKMTLHPMPPGVTKLHLPTHTISKPKLLAKPPPPKSSDTLELHTMLVCTSAIQSAENMRRAFARAAGADLSLVAENGRRSSAGDNATGGQSSDNNKPLNGGEVDICIGCITRERKRAARKKVKKAEEEDTWHKDEHKRVIVFNTHEMKDWQPPSKDPSFEIDCDRPLPAIPDGAMQVDAPMRIACYCRHHNEKLGFQVIFTIKDHENHLVAQAVTSSIMITDDHKTHTQPPILSNATSTLSDGPQLPGSGVFSSGQSFEMPAAPSTGIAPFRLSQSTSDLQGLQHNFAPQSTPGARSFPPSQVASQSTSATMTPRNLSRQASPSAPSGPSAKKRKASGSAKVPSGLAMTRLENSQTQTAPNQTSAGPSSSTISAHQSPYTPQANHFMHPMEQSYIPAPMTVPPQFNTGPPTPNSNDHGFFTPGQRSHSMENLPLQQMFSAPSSAHPSRPPSPNGAPRSNANCYHQSQAQMAQAVANSFYGVPLALNPHRPPTIHKLIPNEGPRAGGIEVTCLGSGFCQGLEVMFGDSLATTTTFWGESSLVCLLPPAVQAGTVAVTFKHQHQQQMQMQQYPTPSMPKQQVLFKYLDDDEQQLLRLALSVLGHKMTGRLEDVGDIARRIVGSGSNAWGPSNGNSPTGGSGYRQASHLDASMLGMVDLEATLLKVLELVDLDDSPNQPRFNMRRSNGQTMLMQAASLGMHRFIAGLLARGANPDARDKGGYSALHFAALHNHPQIVRRLKLAGGDPTMRSLRGYRPVDLSTSYEVAQSTHRIEHHYRSRSAGTNVSRTSSATSLRPLWEPSPALHPVSNPSASAMNESESSYGEEPEDEDEDDVQSKSESEFWIPSRRNSSHLDIAKCTTDLFTPPLEGSVVPPGYMSPAAGMVAWRDQIAAQIQHLQQTVHWNLPNIQMPALPLMPNLPDYQTYLPNLPNPMVRKISSLVPHRQPASRPATSSGVVDQSSKEADYRWWELFSGSSSPPPAYEEIFPQDQRQNGTPGLDLKKSSAIRAAADAALDHAYEDSAPSAQGESSRTVAHRSSSAETIDISLNIGRRSLTKEQQDELRAAHAKKIKRIQSDRNLFFIWIPLLCFVVFTMLKNRVPEVWHGASDIVSYVQQRYHERAATVAGL